MKTRIWPLAALVTGALVSTPPRADTALPTDAAAAQLGAVLSLVSGGTLGTPDHPVDGWRDGTDFTLRVRFPTFVQPPGATLTARAAPLNNGVWDLTSARFPEAGSF